jgi:iron complex outermembrane receptor protein
MAVHADPGGQDPTVENVAGNSPRCQFQISSSLKLTRRIDWDSSIKYVGQLPAASIPPVEIRAYTKIDTRLALQITKSIEVDITGQNLLRPRHFEFGDAFGVLRTEVPRSVFGKVIWRF